MNISHIFLRLQPSSLSKYYVDGAVHNRTYKHVILYIYIKVFLKERLNKMAKMENHKKMWRPGSVNMQKKCSIE